MKEIKKKIKQPNVIEGYDGNGKLTMYYWQEKPFEFRKGNFYSDKIIMQIVNFFELQSLTKQSKEDKL